MYILTVEQMRRAEAAADAAGHTYAQMMESAGEAVATATQQLYKPDSVHILALVGPGNNGGDGLVAAYHLKQMGGDVTCYIWKRKREGDANLKRAEDAGCRIIWADKDTDQTELAAESEMADVILDALLGTGADRAIEGRLEGILTLVRQAVERRQSNRLPWMQEALQIVDPTLQIPQRPATPVVVAVDAPSGLNCDTGAADAVALPAHVTVTFGFPKRGQLSFPGAVLVGKLLIAEIGIKPRLVEDGHLHLVTSQMVTEKLPARPLDAHKGTFGKALIVAGSINYSGAPALAAAAATRVGAGLVTLALPQAILAIVASKLYEPTYLVLPQSLGSAGRELLLEKMKDYQALLIGPGLGRDNEVQRFVQEFLGGREKSRVRGRLGFRGEEPPAAEEAASEVAWPALVIDADALNALAELDEWWKQIPAGCILTPHPGEMARLTGREVSEIQADRIDAVQQAARDWNQVVLLKGAYTVIGEPQGEVYVVPFANPNLATAGTGDVLGGAIAGLMAQGLSPLDAAIVGAFAHGVAAEELEYKSNQGAGTVASDLLPHLPAALQRLRT